MKLKIEQDGNRFRAHALVGRDLNVRLGSSTPDGPWLEGYGDTPDEALEALYVAIGRAYVMSRKDLS